MADQPQQTTPASRGKAAPDTYAIVESGGKQYRAEKGSTLVVDRLPDDEGAKVNLRAVMFRGDKDVVLDASELEKVKVEAVIAGHERGQKVRVLKYKPKKGYRRRAGHRSELTRLEVTDVKLLTRKPAAKAEAKPKAETASQAKTSTAKKAGTAKKPAAKSGSTARKPAAKKPAAKKTTTRKSSSTRKTSTQKKES
jgi:large subunit ribosomal protein L21